MLGNSLALSNLARLNVLQGDALPQVAITGLDTGGLSTTDTTPTITGTYVDPTGGSVSGRTVHILLDGIEVGTTSTDGSGNWSYTFGAVPVGDHAIQAEVEMPTDYSPVLTLTIDPVVSAFDFIAQLALAQGNP